VRWKGTFNFTAGNYVFTSGSDDGNRVYFDDNLDGNPDSGYIINRWVDQGYSLTNSAPVAISAGNHTLVFEYYDNAVDSEYSLSWAKQIDGTINVRYTVDGVAQNSNQSINYSISGPTPVPSASRTVSGSSSHTNMTAGSYTFTYSSGAPAGTQPASSGFITTSATQTLTAGGSITFTMNFVRVPTSSSGCNSADPSQCTSNGGAGGSPVCNQIKLSWSDVPNETGYNVYRNTVASFSGATKLNSSPIAANTTYYFDAPGDVNPYYYYVTALYGASESPGIAAANNALSAISCQANLTSSDKDITAVNGANTSAIACDGAFQGSYIGATAVKFYEGDTISFKINACNTSGQGPATSVSILDTLTNLEQPNNVKMAGSNMVKDADCSTPSVANHYAYCPGTKVVRFYLGTINTGSSVNITFDSLISPASSIASRFNNSSVITYTRDASGTVGSRNANTPWLPYYSSTGVPTRTEVPPE
jgi:hypothetical protein